MMILKMLELHLRRWRERRFDSRHRVVMNCGDRWTDVVSPEDEKRCDANLKSDMYIASFAILEFCMRSSFPNMSNQASHIVSE